MVVGAFIVTTLPAASVWVAVLEPLGCWNERKPYLKSLVKVKPVDSEPAGVVANNSTFGLPGVWFGRITHRWPRPPSCNAHKLPSPSKVRLSIPVPKLSFCVPPLCVIGYWVFVTQASMPETVVPLSWKRQMVPVPLEVKYIFPSGPNSMSSAPFQLVAPKVWAIFLVLLRSACVVFGTKIQVPVVAVALSRCST